MMMRSAFVLVGVWIASQATPPATRTVTVINPIDVERPAETIVLGAPALLEALQVKDVRTVRVRDDKSGQDVLTQAVDLNDDGTFDELIFQADLAAKETRRFTLTVGERRIPKPDEYRAYGRFNRERRDDFAWENDRVAHRMYGAALETWAQEPLTSSGLDVWVKRTPRLVINDWYMTDDYHRDSGEGADLYSVGRTRGCGGSGLLVGGRLFSPPNFRNTRVLAQGPIRVMFELMYEPWDAGGTKVTETKRVTLDAGSHVNKFELTFQPAPMAGTEVAAGVRVNPGQSAQPTPASGIVRTWEPLKQDGYLGCAVIVPGMARSLILDGNTLAAAPLPATGPTTYYSASAWDRGGHIKTVGEFDAYLLREAERIKTPVQVRITSAR
jgi:hypothetical protein